MIHAIRVQKLKQKNNPTETSFTSQLNNDGRNIL